MKKELANSKALELAKYTELFLRRSEHAYLEIIPSLRALSQKLGSDQIEARHLCTQVVKIIETELQALKQIDLGVDHSIPSLEQEYEDCSLLSMIQDTLTRLSCPLSWFQQPLVDYQSHCLIKNTQRGLTLLISQISLFDSAPKITLKAGNQEQEALVEIVAQHHLKRSIEEQQRFDQDVQYVREIAEKQGGHLHLSSNLNGSIKLSWSFINSQEIEIHAPLELAPQVMKSHIWLIDDEAGVRMTVKRWLKHLGYSVDVFEEGSVLLSALEATSSKPALIICDADMPNMTGLEVLSNIAQIAPQIKRLLYTAREPNRWVIEAFNRGVVHRFIDKSEGPEALKLCLEDLLRADEEQYAQVKALDELLSKEMITLHVQPLFASKTNQVEAVEALMRSQHPAFRGPLDILNATQHAEREFDLQKVLTRLSKSIRETIPKQIKLFMNIDPVVFGQPDRLDEVFSEVYPYASTIVLELTERGQLCGDAWVESVNYLRTKGFEIALDDLGAGYNSLGAVAAVSPEIIKLDISLVSNVHLSNSKKEMVHLLSEYALRHEIKTVAEGIEMAEEASICTELGITWLQGYHLARPMPLDQFMSVYSK